jgi:hypothetical protein
MQVKVNGQPVEIFAGAKVRDVLRRYSRTAWKRVRDGGSKVCDTHGHEVGLDGELTGGEELITRDSPCEEPHS